MNHGSSNATTSTSACEMSMLWNWQTIDTCFLSESWHVTNQGMFAASCVGVALLALSNEALRRLCKEYDHLVMRQLGELGERRDDGEQSLLWFVHSYNHGPRRATAFQQLVRTLLHVLAVAVGYILMLVLMSFNGYTFISVLIGTGIGKFFCDWMTVGHEAGYNPCPEEHEDGEKLHGSVPLPQDSHAGGCQH